MKFDSFLKISTLLIAGSMLSGCGTSGGNNPADLFNGAVFISDREGVNELYITDSEATTVSKISPDGLAGSVKSFSVSPNIGFITYLADQDTPGANELYYLKKTTGGTADIEAPVKVNSDLVAGRNVTLYEWSPNGLFIAYISDEETQGVFELYVSDARSAIKVSPTVAVGDVVDFKWSPDSKHIAFTAPITGGAVELHVSRHNLNTVNDPVLATQISSSSTGAAPVDYEWSPSVLSTSNYIAYMSDQDTAAVDLYTTAVVEMTDTANALANTIKVTDATTDSVQAFRWPNLNDTALAFTAMLPGGDINLFATNPDNNADVLVLSAVTPGGGVTTDFLWSPNNSFLAYVADQDTPGVFELYTTTTLLVGTDTVAKVSTTMAGTGVDVTDGFIWGLFSNQLIYRADQETAGVFELFTSTTDGVVTTQGQRISGNLTGGNIGTDFQLSPFGNTVSYIADQDGTGELELYGTGLTDNNSVVKLSSGIDANEDVLLHDWSADGTKVFYLADQGADEVFDVYTAVVSDLGNLNLSNSPAAADVTHGALIDGFGVTDNLVSP